VGRVGRVPPLEPQARRDLIDRLRCDGRRIAAHFELEYEGIDPENARVKRRYGSCHSDGRIKIRLTHIRTGRPLKYSSMVDTLCHELAHLKHFNHGPHFKAFYFRILDWAREEGIYSPSPMGNLTAGRGAPAAAAAADRITPPPPGLWGQVEALAQALHPQDAPPPPPARAVAPPRRVTARPIPPPKRATRPTESAAMRQLGLFE